MHSERKGDHVHERVCVGDDFEHLALAGTLVLRIGEWQELGAALRLGAEQMKGRLSVEFVGDAKVTGSLMADELFPGVRTHNI